MQLNIIIRLFEFCLESSDLRAISEINSFNFFKATIQYGPNFAFSVRKIRRLFLFKKKTFVFAHIQVILTHSNTQIQQDSNSNMGFTFDLRFITTNNKFLTTAHQLLNGKLIQFLNRTRSVKQFIRVKTIKGHEENF